MSEQQTVVDILKEQFNLNYLAIRFAKHAFLIAKNLGEELELINRQTDQSVFVGYIVLQNYDFLDVNRALLETRVAPVMLINNQLYAMYFKNDYDDVPQREEVIAKNDIIDKDSVDFNVEEPIHF